MEEFVQRSGARFSKVTVTYLVSLAAVISVVTQRSSPGALRDDTKNGCEGDDNLPGPISVFGDKCFLREVNFC